LNFAPSLRVHIAPTTLPPDSTGSDHDNTTWSERGRDLKTLLAQLYGTDVSRVEFADTPAASSRYDVTLTLPNPESEAAMGRRVRDALERRFHLSVQVESRWQDVYVVTAPLGPAAGLKPDAQTAGPIDSQELVGNTVQGEGQPTDADIAKMVQAKKTATGVSLSEISVTRGTIADLCRTLQRAVDRPVLDESHLTARYDFELEDFHTRQQLFDLMQSQLGLVVKPERRQLRFLVVRPA
jgi:uncharacterized protein (TIGR03435 family)